MKPDERLLLMFSSYTVQKKPKMLQIYELYLVLKGQSVTFNMLHYTQINFLKNFDIAIPILKKT